MAVATRDPSSPGKGYTHGLMLRWRENRQSPLARVTFLDTLPRRMAYEKTVLDELSYHNVPAIIVGVALPDDLPFGDEPLEELGSLCSTAGLRVRGAIHQNRKDIDTAYFVGKGKAGEIAEAVKETGAKVVVFDNEL